MIRTAIISIALILCNGLYANVEAAGQVRFGVISDPHLYYSQYGTTGEAFEEYIDNDRKMIRESEAILEAAVNALLEEDLDFVMVPGDLTKDGELLSHNLFSQYMQILEDNGIPVFPICGNHDINNPHAYAYEGSETIPVKNVSPSMFKSIYQNFAYDRAILNDWSSLSYVVEPWPGLWLVAIDSCKYQDNEDYPETGGAISPFTLNWLESVMNDASDQGKIVLAFLHHGVLEHFKTQSILFPEYLVDDWKTVSQRLAEMGIKIVFTGHYHAQDIVKKSWQEADTDQKNFIFDIETGSLVTFPVPYRVITLNTDQMTMEIESRQITEIDYDTGGVPFTEYAYNYLYDGLMIISYDILTDMIGLSEEDAADLAPYASDAMAAHYVGDEQIDMESKIKALQLLRDEDALMKLMGVELMLLWDDLEPADNNLVINLTTGEVQ